MRVTCTKRWSEIPFAHRQHTHKGHCRFIHGHNWSIELEFEASKLDENGFVIDFGGLGKIKQWIEDNLDHALVLSETDPIRAESLKDMAKLFFVPDCSCEGLASYLGDIFGRKVAEMTEGRVGVIRCTIFEDSKNSATVHFRLGKRVSVTIDEGPIADAIATNPDLILSVIAKHRAAFRQLLKD